MKFENIRMWEGTQPRAFEELSFQLFSSMAPTGSKVTRFGTPDGGIEWIATLPDNTEWGWQVKYMFKIDDALNSMTKSIERALIERPSLVKMFLIIPIDPSGAKTMKGHKSGQEKFKDKVAIWEKKCVGRPVVDFQLIQKSDLVNELAKQENAGRMFFWWHENAFSIDWLNARLDEQIAAAGQKFSPQLQVDLPVQSSLEAFRFDEISRKQFRRIQTQILGLEEIFTLDVKAGLLPEERYVELLSIIETLTKALKGIDPHCNALMESTEELSRVFFNCHHSLGLLFDEEAESIEIRKSSGESEAKISSFERYSVWTPLKRLWNILDAQVSWRENWNILDTHVSWRESPEFLAMWKTNTLCLFGPAGAGKTHLLLGLAQKALSENSPSIFISASGIESQDPWKEIIRQIGISDLGTDDFLESLNCAALASGIEGARFLLLVDAINESPGGDYWKRHLPLMISRMRSYPHIGLVISCRDTYRNMMIDPETNISFIELQHKGFAGNQTEAVEIYFSYYGISQPRTPLLAAEFSNPLFLKMYCESYDPRGKGDGQPSRIEVFQRYLDDKFFKMATKLRTQNSTDLEIETVVGHINQIFGAILNSITISKYQSISLDELDRIIRESPFFSPSEIPKLMASFVDEGILSRESLRNQGEGGEDYFRILYQLFSDYLILQNYLRDKTDVLQSRKVVRWFYTQCSYGVLEAATTYFPEEYKVELPDFLNVDFEKIIRDRNFGSRRRQNPRISRLYRKIADRLPNRKSKIEKENRGRYILRSVMETLPYRKSSAVTLRTIEIVNKSVQLFSSQEFYDIFIAIAAQPHNLLNGERLHDHLQKMEMAVRDSQFGRGTYLLLEDQSSATASLARWASKGPYPGIPDEVLELACIPLMWLLSSSNRFTRDWITKALVQLLSGHINVMSTLYDRFLTVNDPYVLERLFLISYGSLLKTKSSGVVRDEFVKKVYRFAISGEVPPDQVVLHCLQNILNYGETRGILSRSEVKIFSSKVHFAIPLPTMTKEEIEEKYGIGLRADVDSSYSSLLLSIDGMGDFGRYVIEPSIRNYSRHLVGDIYPPVAKSPDNHSFPAELARRWIFERVLRLGWTPERFGRTDQYSIGKSNRESHKSERWGKKYQWIALFELIARVNSNYQPLRKKWGSNSVYDDFHELMRIRDIDPTLPPVPYSDFIKDTDSEERLRKEIQWKTSSLMLKEWPPMGVGKFNYGTDYERFLGDRLTDPLPNNTIRVSDSSGNDWFILEASWDEPINHDVETWKGIQQHVMINSFLIDSKDRNRFKSYIKAKRSTSTLRLFDECSHIDSCYVYELDGIGHECPSSKHGFQEVEVDGHKVLGGTPYEEYVWEGSILDCSISNTVKISLPSWYLRNELKLKFSEEGPSWFSPADEMYMNYYSKPEILDGHALLIRCDVLEELLKSKKLLLVSEVWFRRLNLTGDYFDTKPTFDGTYYSMTGPNLEVAELKP